MMTLDLELSRERAVDVRLNAAKVKCGEAGCHNCLFAGSECKKVKAAMVAGTDVCESYVYAWETSF